MSKSKKRSEKPFTTVHKLDFLSCPWERDPEWNRFKIGTCHGLWRATAFSYDILAIQNDTPGNGHFEDVMQWFEHACRREHRLFRIMQVWNEELLQHLVYKRGFTAVKEDCIKKFSGNEV